MQAIHASEPLLAWGQLEDYPTLATIRQAMPTVPDQDLLDALRAVTPLCAPCWASTVPRRFPMAGTCPASSTSSARNPTSAPCGPSSTPWHAPLAWPSPTWGGTLPEMPPPCPGGPNAPNVLSRRKRPRGYPSHRVVARSTSTTRARLPIPPIPGATRLFEGLYKGRTSVERVNGRLKIFWGADDGNVTGGCRFHAFVGTVLVAHLVFATLLARPPR
jgi:hypothetical protein